MPGIARASLCLRTIEARISAASSAPSARASGAPLNFAGAIPAKAANASLGSLCSNNELKQLLRIIEPRVPRNRLGMDSPGICRHEGDLVHVDGRMVSERDLQLLGECCGICARRGERAEKACQIGLGDLGEKWMLEMPAAKRNRAKLCSVAPDSRGTPSTSNWLPLAAKRSPASRSLERRAQFLPGGFKLRRRPGMSEVVKARELEQNVEATDKAVGRRDLDIGLHHLNEGMKLQTRLANRARQWYASTCSQRGKAWWWRGSGGVLGNV